MTERMRFVADYLEGVYRVSELAQRYGVSRKTAYKWLKRFEEEGPGGLQERAPVAEEVWNRTETTVEEALVAFRKKHVDWGPRKILDVLGKRQPDVEWPATSTVAAILKRNGLVEGRRRRRREGHPGPPAGEPQAPNEVWGMDFKGQFRTRDRRYCFPFTVTDLASRYLLCCDGYLSIRGEEVRTSLERVFRQHGMPEAIRSDNGAPFASHALGRLSTLSVWWVRLGIPPELIEPAHPEQNGRHERMHRTLKAATARPPQADLAAQQRRFEAFRVEFNTVRPHEGLHDATPASCYAPSPRPYARTLAPVEYPGHFERRLVSRNGGIRWNSQWVNVSHLLAELEVGFEEIDDGLWDVYFGPVWLGRFHEAVGRIVDRVDRSERRSGGNHKGGPKVLPIS